MVRLFDIQNGKVTATEHCYTLKFLKDIMDEFPQDHLKIYAYLFYMSCPNPDLNPFFDVPEQDKEEMIMQEVGGDFSSEEEMIQEALHRCKKLYETPTYRAYQGIKIALALAKDKEVLETQSRANQKVMEELKKQEDDRRELVREEQNVRASTHHPDSEEAPGRTRAQRHS